MTELFIPLSIGTSSPVDLSPILYDAVSIEQDPIVPRSKLPFYRTDSSDDDSTDNSNQTVRNGYDSNGRNIVSKDKATGSLMLLLVVILITIIIFVAVLSVYDVIKEGIVNRYARRALLDPRSNNSPEDIQRTLIANEESYNAAVHFSIICILIAMIILPFLFYAYISLSR